MGCPQKRRELWAKRRKEGICVQCKTPTTGHVLCLKCQKIARKAALVARKLRIKAGLCSRCGKNIPVKGKRNCSSCAFKLCEIVKAGRQRMKTKIISAYGGKCECCGELNPQFLTVDHINGGGRVEARHGSLLYQKVIASNFSSIYRVLCFNCNCARSFNGGICPHKIQK